MYKLFILILLLFISCNKPEEKSTTIDESKLPTGLQKALDKSRAKAAKRKQEAKEPDKILKAFGYSLGAEYKPNKITSDDVYDVTPAIPNKSFNEYKLFITPTTKNIYAISARGKFNSKDIKSEFNVLRSSLEKKYGKFETDINLNCKFIHKDRYIKISKASPYIILTYFDTNLNIIADKEEAAIKSKTADSSGL
jgi:hypothetical protein